MLQMLATMGATALIATALLTGALASARASFNERIAARTQSAMTGATAQFLSWVQRYVAAHGADGTWPQGAQPPTFTPICDDAQATRCPLGATATWTITGATAGFPVATDAKGTTSQATDLAQAVDEQRVAASITVVLTDPTGKTTFGTDSRHVTVRVFDAPPYAAITADEDATTERGNATMLEGDTGGADIATINKVATVSTTDALALANGKTLITTSVECQNSTTFDESNPTSRNDVSNTLKQVRLGGALQWQYETPCTPQFLVSDPPTDIQKNYTEPQGDIYGIQPGSNESLWQK